MQFLLGQPVIVSAKASRFFQKMGKIKKLGRSPGSYLVEFGSTGQEMMMFENEISAVPESILTNIEGKEDDTTEFETLIGFRNGESKLVLTGVKPKVNWGNDIIRLEFDDFEALYPISEISGIIIKLV